MKKIAGSTLVILALFPWLALASGPSGALSFAPPPSDLSVVFLGNIFGIVDGVLHGTGSQIMGNMFGIFNAAVLALGGMVIMYTLMVSTMNTAHEGEVLGKKWSEIWIPVRSSLGLALLVPKASGYCMMQIFFMWIVVQGVGAADKIWGSALSYLNRGGVIVQATINPTQALLGGDGSVTSGASTILSGQACMLGLEKALINKRSGLLNAKTEGSGDCVTPTDPSMQAYCDKPVPSFLDSVNAVTFQTNNPIAASYTLPMPNFSSDAAPYDSLNGVCGNINWNNMNLNSSSASINNITTLSDSEKQTANMSRAIAIQQMYMDLAEVAQKMIANDYQFSPSRQQPSFGDSSKTPPLFAFYQYGVPFMSSGVACKEMDPACISWGGEPQGSGNLPAIFNGTEFQGAIADYNAVMLPTLTLINESQNTDTANQMRAFISKANAQGWMLAGSYFFNLANINTASSVTYGSNTANYTDQNTGLDETNGFSLTQSIDTNLNCPAGQSSAANTNLCLWLGKTGSDNTRQALQGLMNNTSSFAPTIPSQANPGKLSAQSEPLASTVYGFINNSLVIQLPGQPGLAPYQFQMGAMPKVVVEGFSLPKIDFDCGTLKTLVFFFMCIASTIGKMLYNEILRNLFNWLLGIMLVLANKLLMLFLFLPLKAIAYIFSQGISYIQMPGINPVLGLATMGTWYINFANSLWMMLIQVVIIASVMPFGVGDLVVIPMLMMIAPLLTCWLGIMVGVGLITAYYIPFLPYMIFTFGSIAWLMAVIEAMVAAPIVALGVTNPEGEGLFGKGEHAILILMNVFLRPSLMILGYIAGIILSFVAVWVINAGFSNVVSFMLGSGSASPSEGMATYSGSMNTYNSMSSGTNTAAQISSASGYTGWAGIYGFFFSMVIYVSIYIVVVQKAFSLIVVLPDKVLTWIGGQNAGIGEQAAAWGDETKSKISEGGKETYKASQQVSKQAEAYGTKALNKLKGGGPDVST